MPDDAARNLSEFVINEYQRVDYAIGHGFHKFLAKKEKTRCVPGPGGVWRRSVLEQIFPRQIENHDPLYLARAYCFDAVVTAASMAYTWREIDNKKRAILMFPLLPVVKTAIQAPVKLLAAKSFVTDMINNLATRLYVRQDDISDAVGATAKKAMMATVNQAYNLLKSSMPN